MKSPLGGAFSGGFLLSRETLRKIAQNAKNTAPHVSAPLAFRRKAFFPIYQELALDKAGMFHIYQGQLLINDNFLNSSAFIKSWLLITLDFPFYQEPALDKRSFSQFLGIYQNSLIIKSQLLITLGFPFVSRASS